jgi:predicted phage terminase large subunit-like protein
LPPPPVPDGGAIFKQEWIKYYNPADLPKKFEQVVLSWDMTFKDGSDSDFVVGQVWGKQGGMFFLLDQARGQWSFTETVEKFIDLSRKWPEALKKLVEDKANGPAVIDTLKKSIAGITPVQPDGSKTARAYAVTPLFEAGNVYVPNPAWREWSKDFTAEITSFPSAAHDDQVDAMTQALRDLTKRLTIKINPKILRGAHR